MTKTTDINFISNNVKGIQNSLKRLKNFYYNVIYVIMALYFFEKLTLPVKIERDIK